MPPTIDLGAVFTSVSTALVDAIQVVLPFIGGIFAALLALRIGLRLYARVTNR